MSGLIKIKTKKLQPIKNLNAKLYNISHHFKSFVLLDFYYACIAL